LAKQNPYSADQQPDLSLADYPDVASGSPRQSMPVNPPTIPRSQPGLSTSQPGLDMMELGLDPTIQIHHLDLAGADCDIPAPSGLADPHPQPSVAVNLPTFYEPHFEVPPLQSSYNLTEPGIDWEPPFGVDPAIPDLTHYIQPKGAAMIIAALSDPLAIDPMAPDLSDYDRPSNLTMPGPLMVDPALPDLKYPTLTQEVHMPDRPSDLAASALDTMHLGATYRQLDDKDYPDVFFDQSGVNSTRERRAAMRERGLDSEES
jgi:hypothetical protein